MRVEAVARVIITPEEERALRTTLVVLGDTIDSMESAEDILFSTPNLNDLRFIHNQLLCFKNCAIIDRT